MNQKRIENYWQDIVSQDKFKLINYFTPNAIINWHNTNEQFTVDEFLVANCEYPGDWFCEIKRIEQLEDLYITVVRVYDKDANVSMQAISFIKFIGDRIFQIDEYWSEDGDAPDWRKAKKIGRAIE